MRIRMLKTENGSVDGIRVASYEGGAEYVLAATDGERSLAAAFVSAGCAVDLDSGEHRAADAGAAAPADPEIDKSAAPAADREPAAPAAKQGRAKKQ